MKLTTLQENLSHALTTVSRSVATQAQLPALNNILLTTDKGRLKLSATNLETGINLWLGAKIEKEGAISIPAKILTEFISSLPAGKVKLEIKENSLKVICGSYQANFVGLSASEFPNIPSLKGKANITFKASDLSQAVSQVAFAAAQDEGRPVLTGVLLIIKDKNLVLVATDGYRLSIKKMMDVKGIGEVEEFKKGLIIPSRTLSEVAKIVSEGDQEKAIGLAITSESNQVIFSTPETEVVSRLIEGEFPDFEKIIPQKGETKVRLETESLTRATRIASIFARESANVVKLNVATDNLLVSANTAQVGSNISEVEAKVTGKKNKIAFNSRYLLDFLNSVGVEEINFELTSPLNPGVFRPVKDKTFLHIIMPVRIQE